MKQKSISQTKPQTFIYLLHRLAEDLNDATRSNAAVKAHSVWNYAEDNIPRVIAWKVLLGQINLDHNLDEAPTQCLLNGIEHFNALDENDVRGGSYLVWDKHLMLWVRTGKAIEQGKRMKQHNKDKDKKDDLFYKTYRDRWGAIQFCTSLSFDEDIVDEAARYMVFGTSITKHLGAATTRWGKPKASLHIHHQDMMKRHLLFYLLEKVDDLLADRLHVSTASESIGFEGPLWTKLPRNNKKYLNDFYE